LEDDSDSIAAANETWSNTEASANDDRPKDEEWDLNAEAPGFNDWDEPSSPPLPLPKEDWGPPCGHKYGTTNTEYIDTALRYDVVTDVEIYGVSTIPEDLVGSQPWNNWTHEVQVAYQRYKEVDHMSEALENAVKMSGNDDVDSWKALQSQV
jgi:hypothetical protein